MLKIDGTTIELTCGDSAKFTISAKDKEGEPYEFQVNDKLKFTLKATNKKDDTTPLIEKTTVIIEASETCDILLEPEDTKELNFKKYFYDIQLIKADGWIDTIIADAIFKVGVEIG